MSRRVGPSARQRQSRRGNCTWSNGSRLFPRMSVCVCVCCVSGVNDKDMILSAQFSLRKHVNVWHSTSTDSSVDMLRYHWFTFALSCHTIIRTDVVFRPIPLDNRQSTIENSFWFTSNLSVRSDRSYPSSFFFLWIRSPTAHFPCSLLFSVVAGNISAASLTFIACKCLARARSSLRSVSEHSLSLSSDEHNFCSHRLKRLEWTNARVMNSNWQSFIDQGQWDKSIHAIVVVGPIQID